jgi:hypothetical protein
MVEYIEAFLAPFQEDPYKIECEGGNLHRITNTVTGFSEVVRGKRGDVFMRECTLDDEGDFYVWRRITPTRLKNMLGRTEREEEGLEQ